LCLGCQGEQSHREPGDEPIGLFHGRKGADSTSANQRNTGVFSD
jgi:hypothetical protein